MLSFFIHYKFIVNSYLVNSQNSFPDHILILQSKWIALKQAIKMIRMLQNLFRGMELTTLRI